MNRFFPQFSTTFDNLKQISHPNQEYYLNDTVSLKIETRYLGEMTQRLGSPSADWSTRPNKPNFPIRRFNPSKLIIK